MTDDEQAHSVLEILAGGKCCEQCGTLVSRIVGELETNLDMKPFLCFRCWVGNYQYPEILEYPGYQRDRR